MVKTKPADLLRHMLDGRDGPLLHVRHMPARPGQTAQWPGWLPADLVAALAARGITAPWRHQVEAADLVRAGVHVVLATGTASGKSLGYLLPVLAHLRAAPAATALYLAPTKALAADQLRSITSLGLAGIRAHAYDGDTATAERTWARTNAHIILTNPDMMHRAILPRHTQWSSFLRRLSFVVIDECHVYRGVFGSHVAAVIRRLRRVLAHHGSGSPVFIMASATAGDPATTATRLTGLPVQAVTDDASPRGGITFGLWEPPLLPTPVPGPVPGPDRNSASNGQLVARTTGVARKVIAPTPRRSAGLP